MKKVIFKVLPIVFLSIFFALASCSNDDENNNSTIKVDLKVIVSGTLSNSPTLEYRAANGELVSETLTSPVTWTKTFNVQPGFKLVLKAQGTIEGNISLDATAVGDGVDYIGNNAIGFRTPSSFEIEINKNL